MSTPVNDRIEQVIANGAASGEVFSFDFPITATTDLIVDWTDNSTGITTTLVLNVDYEVSIVGQTVTITGATVNGDIYTIIGNTPYARDTDFSGATAVTTGALNTDYNSQERQIQQLARNIDYCIRIPLSDDPDLETQLPDADDRADMYIKFDEDGNVTVSAGTGGGASGDVIGPGSATDNAVVRWNGATGELVQNSVAILGDAGDLTGLTSLTVDNINVDGNTIISANTNGNIIITPNGTGSIILDNQAWPQADGTNNQVLSTNGTGQTSWKTLPQLSGVQGPGSSTDSSLAVWDGTSGALLKNSSIIYTATGELSEITSLDVDNVNVNGNTISSSDTNGDLILTPNGTGDLVLDGLNWPQTDGANTNVLTTDGAGQLFWSAGGGGGGGVTGPVSSTDTAIATWNGAGGAALRNTATLIDTTTGKITSVGDTATPGSIQLNEAPSTGSDGITISAPSSVTAYTVTLPSTVGALGSSLVATDGAGTLGWSTGTPILLLSEIVSSPTAFVDFELPSGYILFQVIMWNVVPVTNSNQLYMRTSIDGGMTFTSTAAAYNWNQMGNQGATVVAGGTSDTGMSISSNASNTLNGGLRSTLVDILGARDSSAFTTVQFRGNAFTGFGAVNNTSGSSYRVVAEDNNAIRIYFLSGNIARGNFYLYGIA